MKLENLTYKVSDQQISTSLSGESMILNHKKGMYYGLNEVGSYVWNILNKKPVTVEELVAEAIEEFETDYETCYTDIKNLLQELVDEKLVEIA
jgi:Coenzyme PQQ synthesis protein D (PqqD)